MGTYGRTSFRALNRQIRPLMAPIVSATDREPLPFHCECSSEDCFASVQVSVAEFDAVCADDDHRLVAPGHQVAGEQVVIETPVYAVVRVAEVGESGWADAIVGAHGRRPAV